MRALIATTMMIALFSSGRLVARNRQDRPAKRASGGAASPGTPALTRGRTIFVARCASCHGERGGKALPTGLPLAARNLEAKATLKMVRGRLKDAPVSDQEAVAGYILTLSKQR